MLFIPIPVEGNLSFRFKSQIYKNIIDYLNREREQGESSKVLKFQKYKKVTCQLANKKIMDNINFAALH